jgi:hypothetical protein
VSGIATTRNLCGKKVTFLRFHGADHVVVSEDGSQRVLAKSIWLDAPAWLEAVHNEPLTRAAGDS